MMTPAQKFEAIKTKVEKLRSDKARAEGALAQQMERLKKEFNVDTVQAARELGATLELEAAEAEKAFEAALQAFEETHGNLL